MPPSATQSEETAPQGRGRGRGRSRGRGRGRGHGQDRPIEETTTTRRHANGSAEMIFQANDSAESVFYLSIFTYWPKANAAMGISDTPVSEELANSGARAPIPDSPSNPFSPAEHDSAITLLLPDSVHEHDTRSMSGEEFPDLSTTMSPIRTQTPQSALRAHGSPRASPHSTINRSLSPQDRSLSSGSQPQSSETQIGQKKKKLGAPDVRNFFKKEGSGKQYCKFCRHQNSIDSGYEVFGFSTDTGTSTLRNHLLLNHLEIWVEACDKFKITISAAAAQERISKYRAMKGQATAESMSTSNRPSDIPAYSYDTFVDAITEFIIADDQSLNVIESPHLRKIFMLLKSDLKDSDIPHRTAIRNHIKEVWNKYLACLEAGIKEALGKISFTTDLWTDPNLSPFMAVTAHWIETKLIETPDGPQYKLNLRAELVGFHRVPGHHDGEHLAQA